MLFSNNEILFHINDILFHLSVNQKVSVWDVSLWVP